MGARAGQGKGVCGVVVVVGEVGRGCRKEKEINNNQNQMCGSKANKNVNRTVKSNQPTTNRQINNK